MSKIQKLLRQRRHVTPVGGRSKALDRNQALSTVFGIKQHRSQTDQRQWEEEKAEKKAAAEEIKKINEIIAKKRAAIAMAKEEERKKKRAAMIKNQQRRPKAPVKKTATVQQPKERPPWRLIPIDIPPKDKKYEHFLGYKGTFASRCHNCRELMLYENHICRGL